MIRSVRRHLNPDLQIEGILITKFQNQTNCCRQVLQSIVDNCGDRVRIFDEPIKYVIKVAEAPAFGISLHEYAPKCEAAKAYSNGNMSIFGMSRRRQDLHYPADGDALADDGRIRSHDGTAALRLYA